MDDVHKIGRPALTKEEKESFVQKLEPYLKVGLSIRKACNEAGIPKSTVYDLLEKDREFSDKITTFQQHLSVLLSSISYKALIRINQKLERNDDFTNNDIHYLQWFAVHSKATKEEFGEQTELSIIDPEKEFQRIMQAIKDNSSSNPNA